MKKCVVGKKLCVAYSFRTVPSSQKQWSALLVELCVLSWLRDSDILQIICEDQKTFGGCQTVCEFLCEDALWFRYPIIAERGSKTEPKSNKKHPTSIPNLFLSGLFYHALN